MTLRRMQVSDFRCLASVALEFDSDFTLVVGPNASGKTSLLEAIYLLGRGRSFRTRRLDKLIRSGAEQFVVFGEIELSERDVRLGVEGSAEGIRARVGGERVSSLADLATWLPVQIIDPEVHRLIDEGPLQRRRFLDWGVFHVEQRFIDDWLRYQQVLKQRNAALRSQQPRSLVAAWDADLVRMGEAIHQARGRYVSSLAERARPIATALLGAELSLSYRPGWARDLSFPEALAASWNHDQEMGSTQVGPQRAEIMIRLDGVSAKDRVSRGQQKLLAAALLVAQLDLFPNDSVMPTLLLDDPAAELDANRLLHLLDAIAQQSVQLVVTTLDPDFSAFGSPGIRYDLDAGGVVRA